MSLASDMVAFQAKRRRDYPTPLLRWGLAATGGAFSTFHIDSDGMGTFISCVNRDGAKWWVIVSPKDGSKLSAFANFKEAYNFHRDLRGDTTPLGDVQVEAVLLRPGTRLYAYFQLSSEKLSPTFRYMRPNTPHAVLTPNASITHGAFYFSSSNIRSTCYGFLMTFSMSTLLTNTCHAKECQFLFRELLGYYYEIYTRGSPDDAGALK